MSEIEELKQEIQRLKNKVSEIEKREKERHKERIDIASRLNNRDKLSYIFPSYENICEGSRPIGKVALRHCKHLVQGFSTIRTLARSITDYVEFYRRNDNYVNQKTIRRSLKQLDDAELELIAQCADEIIDVLYKYKQLCVKHQGIDYSDFISENQ